MRGLRRSRPFLRNKVAVITGASEGIGRDMAIGLAEAGADIIICSRREDKLLEVKEAAEKTGRKAAMYVIDIRNVSEIAGLKAFIKAKTDKVDILINNAGYAVTKPAWDVSKNDWDAMVDTGFKGLFFCCQAIGSIMRENGYEYRKFKTTFDASAALRRLLASPPAATPCPRLWHHAAPPPRLSTCCRGRDRTGIARQWI